MLAAGDGMQPPPSAVKRVLIVDDSPDATELLAWLLTSLGHDTRTAHDGLEAVALTETFQPQIVLLDIGLPEIDGYEVARRIRSQLGAQPVLVALTGWGQEEDRRRSREAGFDVHLVKPVDPETLVKLVADLPA